MHAFMVITADKFKPALMLSNDAFTQALDVISMGNFFLHVKKGQDKIWAQ